MARAFPVIEGVKALFYSTQMRTQAHLWQTRLINQYGPVVGLRHKDWLTIYFAGAEAARYLSLNPEGCLSANSGPQTLYGRLFTNAMFFQDGEMHQIHRDAYKPHFKLEAINAYIERMAHICNELILQWPLQQRVRCYPMLKSLSLRLGFAAFFDRTPQEITALVNAYQHFDQLLKSPLIAWKGQALLNAKAAIIAILQHWIQTPNRATKDIIDHLVANDTLQDWKDDTRLAASLLSLLFALHDTSSSSLATLVWQGAINAPLQARWREETFSLQYNALNFDATKRMNYIGASVNEALRWMSPTQGLVRYVEKPCEIAGCDIPAKAYVALALHNNHHDPQVWLQPAEFQPERFLAPRDEHKKIPYQWLPYGGGAHKCLGLHMADLIAKIFIATLSRHISFEYAGRDKTYIAKAAPTIYPTHGLPVRFYRIKKTSVTATAATTTRVTT